MTAERMMNQEKLCNAINALTDDDAAYLLSRLTENRAFKPVSRSSERDDTIRCSQCGHTAELPVTDQVLSEPGDVAGRSVRRGGWKKAVSRFIRLKLRQFDLQLTILQLQVSNEILKLLILRKQRAIASAKPAKRAAESPEDHAPDQAADSGKRTDDADGDSPSIKPNDN